ncbi:MAG TPA: hypothetical protein VNM35_01425 [Chitinophagaceae bacterium]|nr:hypothetical protein [Chitinophagaceae bacterium]
MIKQHPLIILSPVKKDKLETLDQKLSVIRENLQRGTETEFKKVPSLHYGRFVILSRDSFRDEPTVPVGTRLIFSTNFDGDKENHLTELVTQLTKYIDDIYDCCENYPEPGTRTVESRKNYLKKYSIKTSAFFNGAPGRSVQQIHQEASLREYIWNYINTSKWNGKTTSVEIHRAIRKEIDSKPEFEWSKQKAEVQGIKWFNLFAYGLLLIAAIPLIIVGALYLFLFHELWNKKQTLTLSQLDDKKVNKLKEVEDLFPQNQFTQVAVLKPNFIRRLNFQIWMLRTRVLANNVFVYGKLLNIPTIHFARWVLFDNNRHVLFFSNFDGNWQQYLGDFIDQSGWGLTGIFSNTVNFPKTKFMITGGAYDEEHFLAWSRSTQVPTQVWYCPYPHLSIKNINNNTKIRNELRMDLNEEQARIFLKRF